MSCNVSGNFLPFVSGLNKINIPAKMDDMPSRINGRCGEIYVRRKTDAAKMPPNRPTIEHKPIIVFLSPVGHSSVVNTYNDMNEHVIALLPMTSKTNITAL